MVRHWNKLPGSWWSHHLCKCSRGIRLQHLVIWFKSVYGGVGLMMILKVSCNPDDSVIWYMYTLLRCIESIVSTPLLLDDRALTVIRKNSSWKKPLPNQTTKVRKAVSISFLSHDFTKITSNHCCGLSGQSNCVISEFWKHNKAYLYTVRHSAGI